MESASLIKNKQMVFLLLFALLVIGGCASKPTSHYGLNKPGELSEPDFQSLIANVEKDHGPVAANRIRYWATLIKQGKQLPATQQLNQTNQFFNDARFVTDQEIWQREDYWATPTEFLVKDAGDCEDFAIAKYFTLRLMGVDDKKLRISYVKALKLNQPHMVLTYYPSPKGTPLILDNINPQILSAGEREDLIPVYSFNGTTLWLARTRNTELKAGLVDDIKPWQVLRSRVELELNIPSADN